MMSEAAIEGRLATLEREVADLKQKLGPLPPGTNWLQNLTGSISDPPAFLEALEHGRQFRHADRPPDRAGHQP